MAFFIQNLVNGISLGSLYALLAIGYTMVYGILRLINFAHGDIFMLGAYLSFYVMTLTSLPWWLAFLIATILTGILGIVLERTAYAPLRQEARINVLISAIGASFLLENLAILVFGGRPQPFPVPEVLDRSIKVGQVSFNIIQVVIPIVTAVLLLVLHFVVNKTKTGMAMRALATDYEASDLMGININLIISVTFLIGSLLAAVGGILYACRYPQLLPLMGMMPGIKCFIAAVIGGIGNMTGAVVGGMILGMAEIMIVGFLPSLNDYRDGFAFIILILILIIKPTGLFGSTAKEKV
ncbi:MAG: branched-chain amino acid ABC transporter permease [Eubacteriales bacterium]|nr:branched-chain amino acid ABC transporter permease [Clostridiales bacterium]MDY5836190.1 branched-chain amino acid ABC transporter permease [Eubacteriales bacterium]